MGDTKGDGVHGASMIDGLHTTLIILQLHMRGKGQPPSRVPAGTRSPVDLV